MVRLLQTRQACTSLLNVLLLYCARNQGTRANVRGSTQLRRGRRFDRIYATKVQEKREFIPGAICSSRG